MTERKTVLLPSSEVTMENVYTIAFAVKMKIL